MAMNVRRTLPKIHFDQTLYRKANTCVFAINDIAIDIDSEIRLFSDDCVYREIKVTEDTVKLQEDKDRLGCWARKWGMRFQPVKCNIVQITRKRIKKINASYNLEGTVFDNVENIKYLGVTISNNLKWNMSAISAQRLIGLGIPVMRYDRAARPCALNPPSGPKMPFWAPS